MKYLHYRWFGATKVVLEPWILVLAAVGVLIAAGSADQHLLRMITAGLSLHEVASELDIAYGAAAVL